MYSFSQLTQWDKCRYAWYLTYEENLMLAGPKSRPLGYGSLVHELLANKYDYHNDLRSTQDVLRAALDAGIDQQLVVDAGKMFDRYVNDFMPFHDKFQVRDVERHFELELTTPKGREFVLQGYIDAMIQMQGQTIVLEHKTYNSRIWSPNEIQMDIQTTIYCLAAEQLYGVPVTTAIYNFLNSYPYKGIATEPLDKLFKRVSVSRSPHEQAFVINEIGHTVDQIEDAKALDRGPDGPAENYWVNFKKSLGKACSMCQFQQICLSEMKGIPTEGIKKSLYVPRTVEEEVDGGITQD